MIDTCMGLMPILAVLRFCEKLPSYINKHIINTIATLSYHNEEKYLNIWNIEQRGFK